MSYELDQDTALECIDEWAEPDENGFDFTTPLNYSSTLDYDPDEPYYTWNGDPEEMNMYYSELTDKHELNINNPDQHELSKKLQQKNKRKFDSTYKNTIRDHANDIYHYTSKMRDLNKQKYGIIVTKSEYLQYRYFISYTRIKNVSDPLGYSTSILGFVHKS